MLAHLDYRAEFAVRYAMQGGPIVELSVATAFEPAAERRSDA
jgi:hypothetical protein